MNALIPTENKNPKEDAMETPDFFLAKTNTLYQRKRWPTDFCTDHTINCSSLAIGVLGAGESSDDDICEPLLSELLLESVVPTSNAGR